MNDVFCRLVQGVGRCGPQGRIIIAIFAFMNQWIAAGLLTLSGIAPLQAQSVRYTLEQCIEQALKQNIDVQLSMLSETQAVLTMNQAKSGFAPDLSGSAGQFYQSGRSIDRFTNQFVQ